MRILIIHSKLDNSLIISYVSGNLLKIIENLKYDDRIDLYYSIHNHIDYLSSNQIISLLNFLDI